MKLNELILNGCIVDFKDMILDNCEYLSLLGTEITNNDNHLMIIYLR